jgi:hypothetical protein
MGGRSRHWVTAGLVAAAAAAVLIAAIGVFAAWKALRDRRPAPVQKAEPKEPLRLTPDALPERVVGAPLQNKYLASSLTPTDDDVRRLIDGVEFDLWYGVYKRKRKIGFVREVMRKTVRDEPGAYFSSFDLAMRPGFGPDVSYEFEADYYAGDPPFRLVAVKSRSKSADGDVLRDVRFGEHDGSVTETVDGVTKPARTIPVTRDTLAGLFATTVAGPEHVEPGQTATFATFDVDSLKDEMDTVTVRGIGERRVAGVDMPVATFWVRTPSEDRMISNVASGGRPLDSSVAGVTLRPEPRDVAIDQARVTAEPAESARAPR